ncbi:hypothetical protein CPC08DRAFT_726579 [Agrocybe pediades]|nr:hypothetical protein CPC08DRAFT_726579 [Agrocybe pediades]
MPSSNVQNLLPLLSSGDDLDNKSPLELVKEQYKMLMDLHEDFEDLLEELKGARKEYNHFLSSSISGHKPHQKQDQRDPGSQLPQQADRAVTSQKYGMGWCTGDLYRAVPSTGVTAVYTDSNDIKRRTTTIGAVAELQLNINLQLPVPAGVTCNRARARESLKSNCRVEQIRL